MKPDILTNDFQPILSHIAREINTSELAGEVASYIPELAKISGDKFGIHLTTVDGKGYAAGDSTESFSIQSISKVMLLTRALLEVGKPLWQRVSVEPSGDPFNSLIQLEYEKGIPRNPFINAGALVICDVLVSCLSDPIPDYLNFVRKIANCTTINYDMEVADSERSQGFHNRAIINLMKAYGNIHNDVDTVLNFYFHACAISMSCQELSRTFTLFANQGRLVGSRKEILSASRTKRINSLMQTCGFYDEAGEFSFRVGLPGKSGVGGGIAAVHPSQFSVAVWSPKLNPKGNSSAGIRALERLTDVTGSSIF